MITHLQPISLNTLKEPAAGTVCEATGWGVTEEGGMFLAANLQKVSLPVVEDSLCQGLEAARPRDSQPCHNTECQGVWVTAEWSQVFFLGTF